ncbi:MAG: hypothetical protein AAFR04_04460 [Pseudomonadota bacterium]
MALARRAYQDIEEVLAEPAEVTFEPAPPVSGPAAHRSAARAYAMSASSALNVVAVFALSFAFCAMLFEPGARNPGATRLMDFAALPTDMQLPATTDTQVLPAAGTVARRPRAVESLRGPSHRGSAKPARADQPDQPWVTSVAYARPSAPTELPPLSVPGKPLSATDETSRRVQIALPSRNPERPNLTTLARVRLSSVDLRPRAPTLKIPRAGTDIPRLVKRPKLIKRPRKARPNGAIKRRQPQTAAKQRRIARVAPIKRVRAPAWHKRAFAGGDR